MNTVGSSTPTTCAEAFIRAHRVIDAQQMGEPIRVTKERYTSASLLAKEGVRLAQEPDFCKQHCSASGNCPARTTEIIVGIHSRLVRTGELKDHYLALAETHTLLTQPSSSCPYLADPEIFRNLAEELGRGVSPEALADLGIGSEPSPLGGNLATDLDPETVISDLESRPLT